MTSFAAPFIRCPFEFNTVNWWKLERYAFRRQQTTVSYMAHGTWYMQMPVAETICSLVLIGKREMR